MSEPATCLPVRGETAGPEFEAERLLTEAALALEAGRHRAAARAIDRARETLVAGPAPADPETLAFAHGRLTAYALDGAPRLLGTLFRLGETLLASTYR